MKITVVSDLHLEFSDVVLENTQGADVLILSGDITIAEDLHDHERGFEEAPTFGIQGLGSRQELALRTRNFWGRCSEQFKNVIYVAGNHEFYHGRWHDSLKHLQNEVDFYSNIHFLENSRVKIGDVTFVGGTLWTNMNKGDPLTLHAVQDMMNDFRLIRDDSRGFSKLKAISTVERHRRTVEYIQQVALNVRERQDPAERIVVVGHHTPSFKSCNPRYSNDYLMNGAYHSDLSDFILDHPEIVLWTHGHTHECFDYTIGNCRIVCNPRGYETEAHSDYTGWDPHMVVEV